MSMHKTPLTQLEEEGLRAHGLPVGTPSQLSDVFRHGVAWALKAQQVGQEPVYLYRRKGLDSWATCDEERYEELASHSLFDVKVCYDALQPAPAQYVASLDQLLPYLGKIPADVGLLNDALVAARPLLEQNTNKEVTPDGK